MKITTTTDAFLYGVGSVAPAASKRGSLPILLNILIEVRPTDTGGGELFLAATNLESASQMAIGNEQAFTPGGITVPARLLHALARLLPKGQSVTLERLPEQRDEKLTITWGAQTATIRGISPADFPVIPGWTPLLDYTERDRLERQALEARIEAARKAEAARIAALPDRWTLHCVGARVDGQRVAREEHFDTAEAAIIRWHEIEEERVALAVKGDCNGPFCELITDKAGAKVVRGAYDAEVAYDQIKRKREEEERLASKPYTLYVAIANEQKRLGCDTLLEAAQAFVEWEGATYGVPEYILETATARVALGDGYQVSAWLKANLPAQVQEEVQAAEQAVDDAEDEGEEGEDDEEFNDMMLDALASSAARNGDEEEYDAVMVAIHTRSTHAPPGVPVQAQEEQQASSLATSAPTLTVTGNTSTFRETPNPMRDMEIAQGIEEKLAGRKVKVRFGYKPETIEKFFRRAMWAKVEVRYAFTTKHNGDLMAAMPVGIEGGLYIVQDAMGEELFIPQEQVKYLECEV